MERLRPWLDAVKPAQALMPVLAVEVGAACARFDARPRAGFATHLIIDAAALAAGCAVHLIDHVWDAPGLPPPDPKRPVPESERPVDAREAMGAAGVALLAAAVLGLATALLSGAAAFGYGLAAVLLGAWRRAPAVGADTLGYGLGDLATVVALGPLAVLAGFASQASEGASGAFYAGVPVGLAAASASSLRHFTRRPSDAAVQRMTPVVALGEEHAAWIPSLLALGAVAGILLARRGGEYPPATWVATVPLAAVAVFAAWHLRSDPSGQARTVERVMVPGVAVALAAIALTVLTGGPA